MADVSGLASKKVEGAIAHDSAVVGNPVLGGGEARITLPAAVADGDAVRQMHDDRGRQVNHPFAPRQLTSHQRTTLTNTTETTRSSLRCSRRQKLRSRRQTMWNRNGRVSLVAEGFTVVQLAGHLNNETNFFRYEFQILLPDQK